MSENNDELNCPILRKKWVLQALHIEKTEIKFMGYPDKCGDFNEFKIWN